MRIFLVWVMLAFALIAAPLSAQSLKESAALLPVSFLGLPQTQAQFLLNRLQERLSTEFTLVAQSEVADAFDRAVNITLGLSTIRTSVDHGTAFDIAWRGTADPGSLFQAVQLASMLAKKTLSEPLSGPADET